MKARCPATRRRDRRAAIWIAATVLGGRAWGQTVGDTTNFVGFWAGPMVIAPSVTMGYSYDSNLFLNSQNTAQSDDVRTVEPAVQLTVPFSNSTFKFTDTLSWVDYKQTQQVAGRTSNDAGADLNLRFGSLDILDVTARHVAGVAETAAFDPGGEVVFKGNAYNLHTEEVTASRAVFGHRGYRFSLTRNVLKFDQTNDVFFFNYRGFDGEGAYLQPISSTSRLAVGWLATRYDHYDISPGSDPTQVFRTEVGDTVYAQLEGLAGRNQPYSIRVGWERLAFNGATNTAKDFSGPIADFTLNLNVGGGTTLTVFGRRQPYRSFFQENNYYLYQQIACRVVRPLRHSALVGGEVEFYGASYGEAAPANSEAPGVYRRDHSLRFEAYANLAIGERVYIRLSALKNRRYSNYPSADFYGLVVFGGFVLGWI